MSEDSHAVHGAGGYHPFPQIHLAEVIGRGAYGDDNLGPGAGLGGSRTILVPDVLADVDTQPDAADSIDRALVTGAEIAVLIKDAVVGQKYLVIDAGELAVVNYSRRVIDVLSGINKANDNSQPR
ncbi:hypothetical protein ES708_29718 [subsurface metagenome]